MFGGEAREDRLRWFGRVQRRTVKMLVEGCWGWNCQAGDLKEELSLEVWSYRGHEGSWFQRMGRCKKMISLKGKAKRKREPVVTNDCWEISICHEHTSIIRLMRVSALRPFNHSQERRYHPQGLRHACNFGVSSPTLMAASSSRPGWQHSNAEEGLRGSLRRTHTSSFDRGFL